MASLHSCRTRAADANDIGMDAWGRAKEDREKHSLSIRWGCSAAVVVAESHGSVRSGGPLQFSSKCKASATARRLGECRLLAESSHLSARGRLSHLLGPAHSKVARLDNTGSRLFLGLGSPRRLPLALRSHWSVPVAGSRACA